MSPNETIKTVAENMLGLLKIASFENWEKKTLPPVTPKRKVGKWIEYEREFTESNTYRQIKMPVIECSICQEKIAGHIGVMNYCPNCGSEMRGAKNE